MFLHGLSMGFIYTYILNILFEKRTSYQKRDLPTILLLGLVATLGVKFSNIPSFIYYVIEPISFVMIIRVTKNKTTFESTVGYFSILLTSLLIDISVAIVAAPLGYLDKLAALNYKATTFFYMFGIIFAYLFRDSYHGRYLILKSPNHINKEKYTISLYFLHLAILMILFHTNYQVVLYGEYSGTNRALYYLLLAVYIPLIYLSVIKYIQNVQRERSRNLASKTDELRIDILSKTYELTHDTKNIMQSFLIKDEAETLIDGLLTKKKMKANDLFIDIKIQKEATFEGINELDLSIILGNLIDNAIEHLYRFKNLKGQINLIFTGDEIKISNPIDPSVRSSFNKITEYGYSTKGKASSGYGLHNAMKLIEKNNSQLEILQNDNHIEFIIKSN